MSEVDRPLAEFVIAPVKGGYSAWIIFTTPGQPVRRKFIRWCRTLSGVIDAAILPFSHSAAVTLEGYGKTVIFRESIVALIDEAGKRLDCKFEIDDRGVHIPQNATDWHPLEIRANHRQVLQLPPKVRSAIRLLFAGWDRTTHLSRQLWPSRKQS